MKKLTVTQQMTLGFALLLLFIAGGITFSLFQQNKLASLTEQQYEHPFMVTNAIARADGNIVRMSRLMKDIAQVKADEELVKLSDQVNALEGKVLADLNLAKSRYLSDTQDFDLLIEQFKSWKPIREQVIALKRAGKAEEAGDMTRTLGAPKLAEIFTTSQKIYEISMKQAANLQEESGGARNFALILTLVIGFVVIVISLVTIFTLIRALKKQLGAEPAEVMAVAYDLASGKLDAGRQALAPEGSILHSVQLLRGVLHGMISEANTVVGALAQGQFNQRMTGNYAGDLNLLKQGINASADNISTVMGLFSQSMKSLKSGTFSAVAAQQAPGEYGQMVLNMSQAMSEINDVISDINQVVKAMSEGRFDARVKANSQGDLLTLKNNVNLSVDAIDNLTRELLRLAVAQENGDLTVLIQGEHKGRFKELQTARTQSTIKIRDTISHSLEVSAVVNEAALQVSHGSADLSARVQQQAAALEETSATMNEMAAAVQANTLNARKVADLTRSVRQQSGEGVEVMQQTIGAMQSIRESSHKISDIVTLIDGIAFQTNLLALNAAVEAARAGEHGRGFAVVASEVRALAGKSADAAKDIKHLIGDSVTRIENGTQLADKSGEMLTGISTAIEQVADMVEKIATASNEQSVGINQVHLAISDIDRVTQENAALVEETKSASETLSAEANNLRNNMSFFKTGTPPTERGRGAVSRSQSVAAERSRNAALPAPKKASTTKADEWGEF